LQRLLPNAVSFARDRDLSQRLFHFYADFVSRIPAYDLHFLPDPRSGGVWMLDKYVVVNDQEFAYRFLDGEAVVVSLKDSTFLTLNEIASFIWRQADGKSTVKDILDQLAEAGTLFLSLSGGEIFLRDDFFVIAEYARKRNFVLRLSG
jgi:hypothetical protein